MVDKLFQKTFQIQHQGTPLHQCQGIHPKTGLHGRVFVELVQKNIGLGATLQLDHHPHPLTIRFIAEIGDAKHLFFAHQIGNPLHQTGLVDLVRKLLDDDDLSVVATLLHLGFGAHHNRTTPGHERAVNTRSTADRASRGKIRAGHMDHQARNRQRRIIDQGDGCIHHLAQIVRRNVGRHAHGDTRRTVDQKVGKFTR